MKYLLIKNSALIVSVAFHVIIIFLFILSADKKEKKIESPKLFEVGLAGNGFLNSEKPGAKSVEKVKKKSLPKKSVQESIPEKKNEKKPPVDKEKSTEEETIVHDPVSSSSSEAENNNSQNGEGGRGIGTGNLFPSEKINPPEDIYRIAVDRMPVPRGGFDAIQLKTSYPAKAKLNKIEGTVYIRAFIDEYGSVKKTTVDKGIGFGCDEAAQKAVTNTKFQPGYLNNRPVKVQISIPVTFALDN